MKTDNTKENKYKFSAIFHSIYSQLSGMLNTSSSSAKRGVCECRGWWWRFCEYINAESKRVFMYRVDENYI